MPKFKNIINNLNNNPFPNYIVPRWNILFETGTRIKANIPTPITLSVKNILITFINKIFG